MKLFASRYDETDYGGSDAVEDFAEIQDLGLRWSLPGGLKRIELTIRAHSEEDAYDRYNNHLGQIIAIYDSYVDKYIAGQIFEVVPNGRNVKYVCGGPERRLNDDYYSISDFPGAGTNTDVVIKDILTDSVAIANSDQSNIEATTMNIGAWTPRRGDNFPMLAGDAIIEVIKIGNTDDAVMDFYFVDAPFAPVNLRLPLPYYTARSNAASPDWLFRRKDIVPGGLKMARNIWNLRRSVWIGTNVSKGWQTGANGAILIDTAKDFRTSEYSIGDRVYNMTQDKIFTIRTIDSTTQLSMNDDSTANFVTGDLYTIHKSHTTWGQRGPSAETDLWAPEYVENVPTIGEAEGNYYGDQVLSIYEKPVQQQAFVLGSPTIRAGDSSEWGLWRPLMGDSFYFLIEDLYPDAALIQDSQNQLQTFMAVAMDYTYRTNRLRIVPSTGDVRLDVLLGKALRYELRLSELISTAQAREDEESENDG